MNFKAHLPLQTDPIHRIGGKHRIFSQLQISNQFRGGQSRLDKAKNEYSEVDKKVRTIGAKLTKAVDKLQEVQTYFTTELNAASIQAADKVTAAAKKSAEEVTQALQDMRADYTKLKADTSETTARSKE